MLDILRRAQVCICGGTVQHAIRLELANEKQHPAPALAMMDVPLTRRRQCRRGALTLPMEQCLVDRIILIHGGRGIILVRLVQCDQEYVQLLLGQPLTPSRTVLGFMKL